MASELKLIEAPMKCPCPNGVILSYDTVSYVNDIWGVEFFFFTKVIVIVTDTCFFLFSGNLQRSTLVKHNKSQDHKNSLDADHVTTAV